MVKASMTDVGPHADRLRKAKAELQAGIDASALDDQLQALMGTLNGAISDFDDKVKLARNCIPKPAKSKTAAPKPKAAP